MNLRPHSPDWPDANTIRAAFDYLLERQPRPDIERAHAAVLERLVRQQRRRHRMRWYATVAVAAAVVIFCLSVRTGAVPALVARFEDSWVGGTLRNIRAYLSPGADATLAPPAIRDTLQPVTRKFPDIAAAQEAATFPILVPSWLPAGARFKEAVLVNAPGDGTQQVELRYTIPDGYFDIREDRLQGQAAFGNLYDTDDTQVTDVSVSGAPGKLLVHRSGYVQVNWAIRGYVLTVEGTLDADSALRIAASLTPTP